MKCVRWLFAQCFCAPHRCLSQTKKLFCALLFVTEKDKPSGSASRQTHTGFHEGSEIICLFDKGYCKACLLHCPFVQNIVSKLDFSFITLN